MSPETHFTVLSLVVLAIGIGGLFVPRHMSHKLDKEQRNCQPPRGRVTAKLRLAPDLQAAKRRTGFGLAAPGQAKNGNSAGDSFSNLSPNFPFLCFFAIARNGLKP